MLLVAINVVTVSRRTAGAELLTLGRLALIYATQAVLGVILLLPWCSDLPGAQGSILSNAVPASWSEAISACWPIHFRFLTSGRRPCCATVFAYVTGSRCSSSPPGNFGAWVARTSRAILSACSAAVMSGALSNSRVGRHGINRRPGAGDCLALMRPPRPHCCVINSRLDATFSVLRS